MDVADRREHRVSGRTRGLAVAVVLVLGWAGIVAIMIDGGMPAGVAIALALILGSGSAAAVTRRGSDR